LLICGFVIGGVLARLRFKQACICAAGIAILVVSAAFALIAVTNFWFPWLLIVVGQLPVALVWSAVNFKVNRIAAQERKNESIKRAPKIPGYRVVEPAFGHGAYGKVWLARNKSGEWRAVKVVLLESFGNDREPYDREYEGVSRYREVSDKHPGLLRVDFVSEKFATHFYYIMELGDPLEPGWEKSEVAYMPRDLNNVRSLAPQKRLPIDECVRIGVVLSDTLEFLHRSGFTHRDIKPQNILFVKGQPKFADVGLITNIRESDQERTAVGTPGYMPPAPEMPGTSQADIYALGMVLYVISTGCSPAVFPELPETLLGNDDTNGFFLLNCIVLRACQPDPKERFESAAEMRQALAELQATVVSAEPTSA
jgi:serine/threonine protein kinase